MWSVSASHAIGLIAGLLALPIALLAMRFHPRRLSVPGTVRAAAVLMAVSGAVHFALIPHHLNSSPLTSLLFFLNGVAFFGLAWNFTWRWWRLASSALLVATVLGYLAYVAAGLEGPDQVGLATKLVELVALALVLVPVRGERRRRDRPWYWATLVAGVPLLTLMSATALWAVDLTRPDPAHVHAGAVLQATNKVPTRDQQAAAAQLYDETKAAILPYADWRRAWAAGYRPGDQGNLPSTHWMNQAYTKGGYVLDPRHPQGLVYANTKHDPVLLGAMFQMPKLNEFGPDPGGPLTAWHQHENICVTPLGFEFSLMTPFGVCPFGAVDISAAPMLHVWIVDNPKGGPFAVDLDPDVVKAFDRA